MKKHREVPYPYGNLPKLYRLIKEYGKLNIRMDGNRCILLVPIREENINPTKGEVTIVEREETR